MSDSEQDVLEDMLKWLKFMGLQEAKEVINDALTFEEQKKQHDARIAYELTNGENSTREIAKHISVSHVTVGNWQDNWSKLGIVEKVGGQYSPYEHLISLGDIGLECPEIPEVEADDETEEPSEDDEVADNGQEEDAVQAELGDEMEVD